MIAHIAKEIKTSTDGIAGINACGDGRRGSRNTLLAGSHVRGGTSALGN